MVVEGVVNSSNLVEVPLWLIEHLGQIALWLSAAGIVIIFWIIFQIINLIINRKRRKALYAMRDDLDRVEKKVDLLLRKINKK